MPVEAESVVSMPLFVDTDGGSTLAFSKEAAMSIPCIKGKDLLIIHHRFPPEIRFEGLIIDLETTSTRPENGEIVNFGVVMGNLLVTISRRRTTPLQDFHLTLRCFLEEAQRRKYRTFAYNSSFESMWLMDKVKWDGNITDLMETPRKISDRIRDNMGEHKYPKLRELIYPRFFFVFGIKKWDIDASLVRRKWEEHLRTGKDAPIRWIAHHNLLDLISELEIMLWQDILERIYRNFDRAVRFMEFRCDVCGRKVPQKDLVSVTYLRPKSPGRGYQFVEKAVCRECMEGIAD